MPRMSEDQRYSPAAASRAIGADSRQVVSLDAAPEGVGQQLLREGAREVVLMARPPAAAARRCPRTCVPSGSDADASIGIAVARPCATCRARRSSRARSPADPSARDRRRTTGFFRCASIRSRTDRGRAVLAALLQRRDIGRRRRRRRAEHVLEQPLAPQHGRGPVGIRRHRQDAALAEQAAAIAVGEGHAPEVAAVDVRESGSAARAARSRTCSWPSAGRRRCDPRAAELPTNSRVSCRRASRRFSSKSGNASTSGTTPASLPSLSHWLAKLSTSACDADRASIRRTCCSSTAGLLELARVAASSSSSSGMLLQRKNDSRDARSRSLRRYGRARRAARGLAFDAEQEARATPGCAAALAGCRRRSRPRRCPAR